MSVSFIDIKRYEEGLLEEWDRKVSLLSREARFIGGDEANLLEQTLVEDSGAGFAIGCSNGTDAIQLSLRAADIGPEDIVAIPNTTFWATFEAVINVGATPVAVDINRDDLQMDFDFFVQACEKYKPRGAILAHLFGWASSRINDFRKYCKENEIVLIEDGAQAYGVKYNNNSIFKDAVLSTLSFYPAKVFGAAGDAGAVITNDEKLAEKIRSLGNHGRQEHYGHGLVGWNSRLSGLMAGYLNLVRTHIPERIESRRRTAEIYQKSLNEMGINCYRPPAGYQENGYLNVTVHEPEKREQLRKHLSANGIGNAVTYPEAV